MSFWWKLTVFCVLIASVFSAGVYTEKKFHLADLTASAYEALAKAQNGQMEIIKDEQLLEKNHASHKDPCDDGFVPPDDNRVLY